MVARTILLLLLLPGCAACGSSPPPKQLPKVPDSIDRYVREFMEEADTQKVDTRDLVYTNLVSLRGIYVEEHPDFSEGPVGVCLLSVFHPRRSVYLSPKYIRDNPDLTRVLVFHELGHCLLNLDHVDIVGDIMNPTLQRIEEERWKTAVTTMFKRAD